MFKRNATKLLPLLMLAIPVVSQAEVISAPDSYGKADHKTPQWQQIAQSDGYDVTDESGITWSTDGGLTWGNDFLFVGDDVMFRMDIFKISNGTHYADHGKIWMDWDQNGIFSQEEAILYGENELHNRGSNDMLPEQRAFSFTSSLIHLGHEHIGDIWLRGRAACTETIVNQAGLSWNDQFSSEYQGQFNEMFLPDIWYYQGEKEDALVTVMARPELEVPDVPVSFGIFGATGLLMMIGVGKFSRRRND